MGKLFDVVRKTEVVALPAAADAVVREAVITPPVVSPPPAPAASSRVLALERHNHAPLLWSDQPHVSASEQYRLIRTKLLHHQKQPRLLVISSASSGDGKTITAINLAACLADARERSVLLVDADLRRPAIADTLGLPKGPGLSEVLSNECELREALITVEAAPNLHILTSGEQLAQPAELLSSSGWRRLVARLRQSYEFVVFDVTPVAAVADYELVQMEADGVLLVVRPGNTDRKALKTVLGSELRSRLLGLILNGVEDWWLWKTQTYGYYRS